MRDCHIDVVCSVSCRPPAERQRHINGIVAVSVPFLGRRAHSVNPWRWLAGDAPPRTPLFAVDTPVLLPRRLPGCRSRSG